MKKYIQNCLRSVLIIGVIVTLHISTTKAQSLSNNNNERFIANEKVKRKYLKYNFNIGLNYTMLTNFYKDYSISSVSEYNKNISNAHTFHAEAQGYFLNRIGLAFRYDYFAKSGIKSIVNYGTTTFPFLYEFRSSLYMHTISSSALLKTPEIADYFSIVFKAGVDYNMYRNPTTIDAQNLEITANNFGYHLGLSNEFDIHKNFYLGVNFLYRSGLINKINVAQGTTKQDIDLIGQERINLNRIVVGISLGIK